VAVGEDVPQAAEIPITADISAAAMIHRLLLVDSNGRTAGRRYCLTAIIKAGESGEDAGGGCGPAPAPPELRATGGIDVALETGRAGTVLLGIVSWPSFMLGFLLLKQLSREWHPVI
jgi:hypothetical protein